MPELLEEIRMCAFCKFTGNPTVDLYRYSVRRYAHAHCLAQKYGTRAASELIPIGQLREFRSDLKRSNDWERALIDVRDQAIARARKKAGS